MFKVFSEMDFLGWYSTGAGEKPTSAEIAVHRQIMDINESPLFLQLSPGNTFRAVLTKYDNLLTM